MQCVRLYVYACLLHERWVYVLCCVACLSLFFYISRKAFYLGLHYLSDFGCDRIRFTLRLSFVCFWNVSGGTSSWKFSSILDVIRVPSVPSAGTVLSSCLGRVNTKHTHVVSGISVVSTRQWGT